MGGELSSDLAKEIVGIVTELSQDREKLKSISAFNYDFARRYFYSERVVSRLNNIIDAVIDKSDKASEWNSQEGCDPAQGTAP